MEPQDDEKTIRKAKDGDRIRLVVHQYVMTVRSGIDPPVQFLTKSITPSAADDMVSEGVAEFID